MRLFEVMGATLGRLRCSWWCVEGCASLPFVSTRLLTSFLVMRQPDVVHLTETVNEQGFDDRNSIVLSLVAAGAFSGIRQS